MIENRNKEAVVKVIMDKATKDQTAFIMLTKGDAGQVAEAIAHFRGVDIPSMTDMVDRAMIEAQNLHPPLKRSDCERIIKAALSK